jgi:D-amino-acid dehydrogenase
VPSKQHPSTSVLNLSGLFGPYLVPSVAGVRYSYFAEFTAEDDTWTDPAKAQKAENLLKTYTGFQDLEFTRQRACLRPVSCDDLPIIGKFPGLENVYLNVGQGSRGSLLSFGSAMLCAELVTGSQSPSIDPAPFSPSRFYL